MTLARNSLRWLLLAVLPCLAVRCGPHCDECWEPCQGEYRGSLGLRPGSAQWLPVPAADSISFVNSNGYRAVLERVDPAAAPDSLLLPAFTNTFSGNTLSQLTSSQAATTACRPYFRAAQVVQAYQGRNLNLYVQLNLFKNLEAEPGAAAVALTQAVADTLPDVLVLGFNHQYFAGFPVAAQPYRQPLTTSLGETVYLDSVHLVGRTFRGVYQFARRSYTTDVQPDRFFFQPGRGLVGFTYTNNEQWARL